MSAPIIVGAVAQQASRRGAPKGSWFAQMLAREPKMLVTVALANKMARGAETQRQHRSFKPGDPIRGPQSQYPGALTASAARRTAIKSP